MARANHGSAVPPLCSILSPGLRHSAHASALLPFRKKEMNTSAGETEVDAGRGGSNRTKTWGQDNHRGHRGRDGRGNTKRMRPGKGETERGRQKPRKLK